MLRSPKPTNQLVKKPCHPCRFVDAVKGQWMNCIPHIIPHIFVGRVVNEECALNGGTTTLQTIRMLKESVHGFDKKIRSPSDRSTIGVTNYIAPVLVKGVTSSELLCQNWCANTLKGLEYGFQVLFIAARPEGHLKTLQEKLQELSDVFPKCVQPVTTIQRWPLL